MHKMNFLLAETGAGAVGMMCAIKIALNPHNTINPGRVSAV